MMLSWKIRYLDRADKQFKDRYLYLKTKLLDPITQAAVELVAESKSHKTERQILKYKHLFTEGRSEDSTNFDDCDRFIGVGLFDYFEDETGKEISNNEVAQILTGNIAARMLPRSGKQHDIDFMFSK